MTADRLLNVMQACELAGVCRRTLYSWMDAGKVAFVRTAGGGRRIRAASLFRAGNVATTADEIVKENGTLAPSRHTAAVTPETPYCGRPLVGGGSCERAQWHDGKCRTGVPYLKKEL